MWTHDHWQGARPALTGQCWPVSGSLVPGHVNVVVVTVAFISMIIWLNGTLGHLDIQHVTIIQVTTQILGKYLRHNNNILVKIFLKSGYFAANLDIAPRISGKTGFLDVFSELGDSWNVLVWIILNSQGSSDSLATLSDLILNLVKDLIL